MEEDWVDIMEKKRNERNAMKEKIKAADLAVKRAQEAEASLSAEEQRRHEAAKHKSVTSICAKQFVLPKHFVSVNNTTTSDAEEWWNSTLNKRHDEDRVLWTPRMDGEVDPAIKGLVEAYGGKAVLKGYRGFLDDFPSEEDDKGYDQVMAEFREHERLERGRSTLMKGTPNARPNRSENPMGSMKWLDRMGKVPLGLRAEGVQERLRALNTLAQMSEEVTDEEAAMLVELGATAPIIELVDEVEDEHRPKGLHQYLHGTKQGTRKEQQLHVWMVHICAARALRNLLCILSSNFSLQSRDGAGRIGTVTYDWLPVKAATFVDVVVTQPGMFELLFRLLVHESVDAQEHSTFSLLHMAHFSRANRERLLATGGLLDLLCTRVASPIESLQEVSLELLISLMHSNDARKRLIIYKFRDPEGKEMGIVTAATTALTVGSERARGFAAQIIWELCAKDGSQRKFRSLRKAREAAGDSKKKGRSAKGRPLLSQSDVLTIMGDGIDVDYVKQDVCREPKLLDNLVAVIKECSGRAVEKACGAMWCLSLEKANKRRIGLFPGVVESLSRTLKSTESTDKAKQLAANAIRSLASDVKTIDHMSVMDKTLVEQLIYDCNVSKWQLAIVAP